MSSLKIISLKVILQNLKLEEKKEALQEIKKSTNVFDLYLLQKDMHPMTAIHEKIQTELAVIMPKKFKHEMSQLRVTQFLHMGTAIELFHPMFGKKMFRSFTASLNAPVAITDDRGRMGRLCLETYRMLTYDFDARKFTIDTFELRKFIRSCCGDEGSDEFISCLMKAVFDFSVNWEKWEKMNVV